MQESLHSYELQRDGFYRKIENIVVIFTQLSPLQTTNLWLLQIIMLLFNEQIHCQIPFTDVNLIAISLFWF